MTRWFFVVFLLCFTSACLKDRDGNRDAGIDTVVQDVNGRDTNGQDVNGRDTNGQDANGSNQCPSVTNSCALPWVYFVTHDTHRFVRVSLANNEANVCDSINLDDYGIDAGEGIDGSYAPSPCRLFVVQGNNMVDVNIADQTSSIWDSFVRDGNWISFARGPEQLTDSFYFSQSNGRILFADPSDQLAFNNAESNAITSIATRRAGGFWAYWHSSGLQHITLTGMLATEHRLTNRSEDFFAAEYYRIKEARDGRVVLQARGARNYWIYNPATDALTEVTRGSNESTSVSLPDPRFPETNAVIRGKSGTTSSWVNGLIFTDGQSPAIPVFRSRERTRDINILE